MSSWPEEFECLQPVAMRFGKFTEWQEVRDFIDGLLLEERDEISACLEVSARRDWEGLLDWFGIGSGSLRKEGPKYHIFRLFILFDAMGLLKSLPAEPCLSSSSTPATPRFNWSSFPNELSYLIGPATRYGRVETYVEQSELMRWLRPEEIAKLIELAVHIQNYNHAARLERWIYSHDPRLFPEAIPIRNLCGLLKRIADDQQE